MRQKFLWKTAGTQDKVFNLAPDWLIFAEYVSLTLAADISEQTANSLRNESVVSYSPLFLAE